MVKAEINLELTYTSEQIEIFFNSDAYRFVIVPKGRRFGATTGAMHASLEWAIEGMPVLWGDTVNGNIDRYFERIAKPALNKSGITYSYNSQQKKLTFKDSPGFIDFRSADRPENWEGFGYKKIILNEAGIILKNPYLYTNAVLPMMIDFPDSQMFALGVPKGKKDKNGKEHPFFTLAKAAQNKQKGYRFMEFSSYDNPKLTKEDVEILEKEIGRMNPEMIQQEIYGKFVDGASGTLWEPQMIKHKQAPQLKRVVIGIDPSGSKDGDAVGIVAAGKCAGGNYYVLSDRTGQYSPLQWASIVSNEYESKKADAAVAETNFGGDMVESNIKTINPKIRVIKVHASRGKDVRAEPIVSLYEDGRVFHEQGLFDLENEMLMWTPGQGKSPNRVDALVWALTELSKVGTENFVI